MQQRTHSDVLFIIFGATGDLSTRKLIPAIYKLCQDKRLGSFAILGISFDQIDPVDLLARSKVFVAKQTEEAWDKIHNSFYYFCMDFHDKDRYLDLASMIREIEQKHDLGGNRLFYLATMPEHFADITKYLSDYSLAFPHSQNAKPWSRVVYEKPFGWDLASSQQMNSAITTTFNEEQIFRIDHYLGKELVSSISFLRFTNTIFEPLWCNQYIEEVQIILNEEVIVGNRGGYFDNYGTIKDMLQSHMLQLLSLVAMERPVKLSAQYVRDTKMQVLKSVVVDAVIKGQYVGYQEEAKTRFDSETETFVAARLFVKNERWKGVPFLLKTGKGLREKRSCIFIKFRQQECLLTSCPSKSNFLVINIFPDESIQFGVNIKVPGVSDQATPVTINFCHGCLFGLNTPEAYETLLSDVMNGDHSAFVRADEVEASWEITEQILQKAGKCFLYEQGSDGPPEASCMGADKTIVWYS